MALPGIPWLPLFLVVVAFPVPGSCDKMVRTGSLIHCDHPAPALTNATNGTAFRTSLHQLLFALPSAAAPTGFASLHSTGRDRAFVRGLCFGDGTVPSDCLGCLTVAARNLTSGCGSTTRRAGIWTDACFVAYADSDYSSSSEDAFRSRVLLQGHVAAPAVPDTDATNYSDYQLRRHAYVVAMAKHGAVDAASDISGPRMLATADKTSYDGWPVVVRSTVRVLAQCPRDRTEHECIVCLYDSVHTVDWVVDAAPGDGGVAAAVVAFNCYLRFEVSSSLLPQKNYSSFLIDKRAHIGSFLTQCYDPEPALTNDTQFRATLLRLLHALPSAAAPTGFASLNSTTGRGDRAFVRGLCFDFDTPAPSDCLGCLTVAAKNLTSGCGPTTRRAGVWTDGCFVAYADTDDSSPSEDDFRSRVLLRGHVAVPVPVRGLALAYYPHDVHAKVVASAQLRAKIAVLNIKGPRLLVTADETCDDGWPVTVTSTVRVLAQCPRDRSEVHCSLCLYESAQAMDWDLDATRGDGGVAAAVVGFNCYLRFEVFTSVPPHSDSVAVATGGFVAAVALSVSSLLILGTWG